MDLSCLQPAKGFLDPSIMKDEPNLSPKGSENWPYPEELYNQNEHPTFEGKHAYRNNRFRSTAMAITGFTSSIMIFVAEVAFNRKASFQHLSDKHLPIGDAVQAIIEGRRVRPNDLQSPSISPFGLLAKQQLSGTLIDAGDRKVDGSVTPTVPEDSA